MHYLDYQATTPLAPEALEAMLFWLGGPGSDGFANPASNDANAGAADQFTQTVKKLKAGDWLEFREGTEQRTQAKLSYISPLKGTYLFVNRQGESAGEYSLSQLAQKLRAARAVLLADAPLIERAMSSIVGTLKKSIG